MSGEGQKVLKHLQLYDKRMLFCFISWCSLSSLSGISVPQVWPWPPTAGTICTLFIMPFPSTRHSASLANLGVQSVFIEVMYENPRMSVTRGSFQVPNHFLIVSIIWPRSSATALSADSRREKARFLIPGATKSSSKTLVSYTNYAPYGNAFRLPHIPPSHCLLPPKHAKSLTHLLFFLEKSKNKKTLPVKDTRLTTHVDLCSL